MTANINEAVKKIKRVGGTNARVVPMEGADSLTGLQQVEIRDGGLWQPVVTGITRKMGEDIIAQATNRVILG